MKNAIDTRNFDKFEEEEPWFFAGNEKKNLKSDVNFVGYTFKRDSENERSEVVNALENLEKNRALLYRAGTRENTSNTDIRSMEKTTTTQNTFKAGSMSKSPINKISSNNNNNANGNLLRVLGNYQSNQTNGMLKEKALLINLYNASPNPTQNVTKEKWNIQNIFTKETNGNKSNIGNNLKKIVNVKPSPAPTNKNSGNSNNNMKLAQDSLKAMTNNNASNNLNNFNNTIVKNRKAIY